MKIVSINLGNFSSTGRIAQGIKEVAEKNNYEYVLAYPFDPDNKVSQKGDWIIGNRLGRKISIALGMLTGFNGCFSVFATASLLKKISKLNPDVIHLHNLHNNYINLPLLFRYLKKRKTKVVWTLHDCWAFTGQCPYFDSVNCKKWQSGCYDCPRYKEYPKSYFDNTKLMWMLKKKWFSGINGLVIVTPSVWLSNLVKRSFLKPYHCEVINNGIDLSVFKPTFSQFRENNNLKSKKIVLGVAFSWGPRKGLDVFLKLSEKLPDDYTIVLVGAEKGTDAVISDKIVTISRTHSREELAAIYTMADVFVNPTREENYPTVNMEAIACGTPVITFNTGGSAEIIDSESGLTVEDDIDNLVSAIRRVCSEKIFNEENCLKRALQFNNDDKYMEYLKLYERIILGRDKKNRA